MLKLVDSELEINLESGRVLVRTNDILIQLFCKLCVILYLIHDVRFLCDLYQHKVLRTIILIIFSILPYTRTNRFYNEGNV